MLATRVAVDVEPVYSNDLNRISGPQWMTQQPIVVELFYLTRRLILTKVNGDPPKSLGESR